MATISLIVKSNRKSQPVPIYLRFRDGRQIDIFVPTPERVFPEYWSNKTQSFKQRIFHSEVFQEKDKIKLEETFSRMKDFVLKEHSDLKGVRVSKEWLKSVINKFYNKKEPGSETLSQYIKRFIVEAETGKRLFKGKRYTFSTIKNYKGFEAQFNEYQGIYTDEMLNELEENNESPRLLKRINFEDITIDFYNDFLSFFNDKNYSPNTIGRHIKHLKVLMRLSKDEGLHNNSEYQRKGFEAMAVPVDNVYLNETELKRIFDLDLSKNKPYEIARDVFLCGCYTAQRYSDYNRICKDHIKIYSGRRVIEIIQQKTGEKCIIPIRPELDYILKKYDYNLPRTHEQKVNKYIKEVVKLAEITEKVNYEENRGGMKVKKTVPKNELIKTHSARRSGCTNMYLAGIQPIDIMKISGHKTEREFLKYIKVSKEETALSLSDHPYFIGNTLSIAK
jgi:hypothetical protein